MKNRTTFKEKYELSISESMTLKDIQKLCDCGQFYASEIRRRAIDYCYQNDITMVTRSVPTEAVLETIDRTIDYYFSKMELENKIIRERS